MSECKHYQFFQNRQCEFFPCHNNISPEAFNCLFCYCPLYALGKTCGGNFRYTPEGIKDCSGCTFPHQRGNYDKVLAKYQEIQQVIKKMDGEAL